MADMFEEAPEASEEAFSLPGDEELLANTTAGQELAAEQEPNPVSEAARLLQSQRNRGDSVESDIPADAGTTEDAELIEASDADPVQALLAKYGGDQQKALQAAVEAQSLLGRQAQELGEARKANEEWAQWAEYQAQQAQQVAQQSQGISGWEDLIDENPAQATQMAFQQGNRAAYQAAVQAWEELSPGAPQNWYDNQQIKGALAAQHQQADYARRENAGMEAVNSVVERYPDLPDLVDRMVEIAPNYPHEVMALASGNMDVAAPAIESLYLKARGLTSDTLANTAQSLARKQTEEEMRVRQEASVATASRTGAEPPASLAQAIAAEWPSDDRLADGWNVG
jgi:hypothetical protein